MALDPSAFLPLSPATVQILLALAGRDRHGYSIMQEVARHSGGQYKLGPGTLYDNLQKLLAQGLVCEVAAASEDDTRRRYYRLTLDGKAVLAAEVARLEKSIRAAKRHLAAMGQGA